MYTPSRPGWQNSVHRINHNIWGRLKKKSEEGTPQPGNEPQKWKQPMTGNPKMKPPPHILLKGNQAQVNKSINAVRLDLIIIGTDHDDVIKWKHFPLNWPFVRGIHWSPGNSPYKGQWHRALMLSLICARINGWVNNSEADDLRRHRAHYDVTVMRSPQSQSWEIIARRAPRSSVNRKSSPPLFSTQWSRHGSRWHPQRPTVKPLV